MVVSFSRGLFALICVIFTYGCVKVPRETYDPVVMRAQLFVTEIDSDTSFCDFRKVVIGMKADTLCLAVENRGVMCIGSMRRLESEVKTYVGVNIQPPHDRYSVRFVTEEGFIIWVTNLEGWFPSWVISTERCL